MFFFLTLFSGTKTKRVHVDVGGSVLVPHIHVQNDRKKSRFEEILTFCTLNIYM